jgi:hypothetical protein
MIFVVHGLPDDPVGGETTAKGKEGQAHAQAGFRHVVKKEIISGRMNGHIYVLVTGKRNFHK